MAVDEPQTTEATRRPRLLVVDDDPAVRELLRLYLTRGDFEVADAASGEEAMRLHRELHPDLILLDLRLPRMHGLEVCRAIRRTSRVPIIILTALAEEVDRVGGLELGADDYIAKPFSPLEVVARVKAVLRRGTPADGVEQVISLPGLRIDFPGHRVEAGGREVHLTPTEFRLLWCLASQPGRVLSQDEVVARTLGPGGKAEAGATGLHVQRLRKKLEEWKHLFSIATVRGLGYRLDVEGAAGLDDGPRGGPGETAASARVG